MYSSGIQVRGFEDCRIGFLVVNKLRGGNDDTGHNACINPKPYRVQGLKCGT